jgi:hypothetical protein
MKKARASPHDNKIGIPFERAIEKLLATPPKKKPTKPKPKKRPG